MSKRQTESRAGGPFQASVGRVVPLPDVAARQLTIDRDSFAPPADNIVQFAPRRAPATHAPPVSLIVEERPALLLTDGLGTIGRTGLLALSLAMHGGLLFWFDQAPLPLASVGEVSMSVEIVLGTRVTAGDASAPSQSQMQSAPAPQRNETVADRPQTAGTEPAAMEEVTGEASAPAEPEPEPPATITEPATAVQSATGPVPPAAMDGELALPAEEVNVAPPPLPEPRPVVRRAQPAPERTQRHQAEPRPRDKLQRSEPGTDREKRRATPSIASTASSGVGVGRSDAHSNYRGIVFAHLARHQQYPAGARARGEQGSTTITFGIDGSGRVMSVRLTRPSGNSSFDRESEAMVRRASPFPAPPGGRAMSFTIPVNFGLR